MVSRIARERGMRDASRARALMRAILKDTCAPPWPFTRQPLYRDYPLSIPPPRDLISH